MREYHILSAVLVGVAAVNALGSVCCNPISGSCYTPNPPFGTCNGGDFLSGASSCGSTPCGGACCAGGSCIYSGQSGCNGQYIGTGSSCGFNPCPGACCFTNGTCAFVTVGSCTGQFMGIGFGCNPCPQPGSCCQPNGTCIVSLQSQCAGLSWVSGTSCGAGTCPPGGACCGVTGSCGVLVQSVCGGTWLSGTCSPNPCPIACCRTGIGCTLLSSGACASAAGTTLSSTCTPDPCSGACCNLGTGGCYAMLQAGCAALGQRDVGYGSTCASASCQPGGACCIGAACSVVASAGACAGVFLGGGSACNPVGVGGTMNVCCRVDFNNSGSPQVQDIFDYLNAWFSGCP